MYIVHIYVLYVCTYMYVRMFCVCILLLSVVVVVGADGGSISHARINLCIRFHFATEICLLFEFLRICCSMYCKASIYELVLCFWRPLVKQTNNFS